MQCSKISGSASLPGMQLTIHHRLNIIINDYLRQLTRETLSSNYLNAEYLQNLVCFADRFTDILPVKGVLVSVRGWIRTRWTIFTLLSQLSSMALSQRFIRSSHRLPGIDQSITILLFASLLILIHQSSQRTPADDVSWHRRKSSAISF